MKNKEKIVLLVEDDEPKKKSILEFLRDHLNPEFSIIIAESLNSAVTALTENDICFAIIDMSIPSFDLSKDRRGGGQPHGFGGADILRFIDTETSDTRSVVVTQYEEFVLPNDPKKRDPRGLEDALRKELDNRFLGVIHYSGRHGEWRNTLLAAMQAHKLSGDQ